MTTVQPVTLRGRLDAWRLTVPTVVFLGLVAVYGVTAVWTLPYHIDPLTNAYTGWYIGVDATPIAGQHEVFTEPGQRANTTWFVESPRGVVSQYPPGAALTVAPFYAVTRPGLEEARLYGSNQANVAPVSTTIPPVWPATLSAVLVTALTGAVLARLAMVMGVRRRHAVLVGVVAGLGTGAWSIASNMSWTHGPAMLAIALSLLCFSRERWFLGGAALGFGVLVRPHVAVIAAAVGVVVGWRRQSLQPLLGVGVGSAFGLAALVLYNRWIWGRWTVTGGYGEGFTENLGSADGLGYLTNIALGVLAPDHGLLLWAPFLLVLVPIAVLERKRLPDWALGAAIGGVVYLLVQWKANRYSGGAGFFGYRYPLEALVAGSALLIAPTLSERFNHPGWARALRYTIVMAIVAQAVGAVAT